MCGVVGFINSKASSDDTRGLLGSMCGALHHRGPDEQGQWSDPERGVHLGHTRLSIIDLSPMGHQPMTSTSGRYVISYNGEVYNFDVLRKALEAESSDGSPPIQWRGHSDTEVILAAIERWGLEKALDQFVGMFAIALWDRQEQELHLVRDRLGIKPLYYGWQGDTFFFGSEFKAFHPHPAFQGEVNRAALQLYTLYNYIPPPHSIYQGIQKLPPGMRLTLRAPFSERVPEPIRYWSVEAVAHEGLAHPFNGTDAQAIDQLDTLLRDSIGLRMISDVPLGAFLSGGIDSSAVAALMQAQSTTPVKTFSIGFHEKDYNEADHAKAVAQHLKTDHTELYVTAEQARDVIPKMPELYDEPFADSSQIPTFLISEMTRRHVKVSLSGDGGDEVFGGYNHYAVTPTLWQWMQRVPSPIRSAGSGLCRLTSPNGWNRILKTFHPILPAKLKHGNLGNKIHKLAELLPAKSLRDYHYHLVTHWNQTSLVRSQTPLTGATPGMPSAQVLTNVSEDMMLIDQISYLPGDILTKVDRATMGVSLEVRVPLLDHRVVEFAWKLPLSMKIRSGKTKWLLRQVLYRYVPKHFIERPKMGFSVPVSNWLRGPLRDWAEALLSERRLQDEGYFDPKPIRQKWREHISGKYNWQHHLWNILMFQSWLSHHRKR